MTAESFKPPARKFRYYDAEYFSTEKKKCGSVVLDGEAVSYLQSLSQDYDTINDVFDILGALVARDRAVTSNSFGKASSVQN